MSDHTCLHCGAPLHSKAAKYCHKVECQKVRGEINRQRYYDNRAKRVGRRRCCVCQAWFYEKKPNQKTCLKDECKTALKRKQGREWIAKHRFLHGRDDHDCKQLAARPCLRCDQLFRPEGRFNRICPRCKADRDGVRRFAGVWNS